MQVQIGQVVSIARSSGYGSRSQGLYTVTKVNKIRVEVTRDTDGYKRTFSVKTGAEKSPSGYVDRNTFIESVENYLQREAALLKNRTLTNAWDAVAEATKNKNMTALKEAVAALDKLTTPETA